MIKAGFISFFLTLIFSLPLYAKVILITGASGDIGLGLAKHFLKQGDTVLCHYNKNKKDLETLSLKYPKNVLLVSGDFSRPLDIKAFWEQVMKKASKIDVIINSVGIEKEDLSSSQIQETLSVNYTSPRLVCDYALEHFQKYKIPGVIINIGSRAAYRGHMKGYYTYADSKAALTKYSQEIARDHAKGGIFVYVIAPGPVEGKMLDGVQPEVKEKCLASLPTGKAIEIDEIVAAVDLFVSRKVPSGTGGVFDLMGASWFH